MKIFVYGTLKRGFGNNYILLNQDFLGPHTLKGFKLMDAGFPVAVPDEKSSIVGEVFDIGDDEVTLNRLDRLESNGIMYDRTPVDDLQVYIGNEKFWKGMTLEEIPSTGRIFDYQHYRQ